MSLKGRRLPSMILVVVLLLVPVSASAAPMAGPSGAIYSGFGLWNWVMAKVSVLVEAVRGEQADAPTATQKAAGVIVDIG